VTWRFVEQFAEEEPIAVAQGAFDDDDDGEEVLVCIIILYYIT
jgi:hypothetical protein